MHQHVCFSSLRLRDDSPEKIWQKGEELLGKSSCDSDSVQGSWIDKRERIKKPRGKGDLLAEPEFDMILMLTAISVEGRENLESQERHADRRRDGELFCSRESSWTHHHHPDHDDAAQESKTSLSKQLIINCLHAAFRFSHKSLMFTHKILHTDIA